MIDNSSKTAIIFGIRNELSISFSIAKKLRESGCEIAVSYTKETSDEVLYLCDKEGWDKSLTAEVDIRNEEDIQRFVHLVVDKRESINYVLHGTAYGNHSVMCSTPIGSSEKEGSYLDIKFDSLMDSFNISAYSLIRICRVVNRFLAPDASILTLTYNASQRVFNKYAGMAISKAALENMVKYLAEHFGPSGIRVNGLSPGLIMTTSAAGINGVRALRRIGKESAPLGNVSAEEAASAALFYFSDLSKSTTGNIHFVDGGFNIMGTNIES